MNDNTKDKFTKDILVEIVQDSKIMSEEHVGKEEWKRLYGNRPRGEVYLEMCKGLMEMDFSELMEKTNQVNNN